MQTLILNRYNYNKNATHGTLTLLNSKNIPIFSCVTLELPWLDNKRKISCIPDGIYMVRKENHLKFGFCFRVSGVPDRDGILIHVANFVRQLQGCIAVGNISNLIDKDDIFDIINSRNTMNSLYNVSENELQLIIKPA